MHGAFRGVFFGFSSIGVVASVGTYGYLQVRNFPFPDQYPWGTPARRDSCRHRSDTGLLRRGAGVLRGQRQRAARPARARSGSRQPPCRQRSAEGPVGHFGGDCRLHRQAIACSVVVTRSHVECRAHTGGHHAVAGSHGAAFFHRAGCSCPGTFIRRPGGGCSDAGRAGGGFPGRGGFRHARPKPAGSGPGASAVRYLGRYGCRVRSYRRFSGCSRQSCHAGTGVVVSSSAGFHPNPDAYGQPVPVRRHGRKRHTDRR